MLRLPDIARGLGDKRLFKRYLDEFLEPAFYAVGESSQLCQVAAEQALQFLSEYLGPNIFRGRVEQLANPRYLNALEFALTGANDGVPRAPPSTVQGMEIAGGGRSRDGGMPSLGGTPT